MATFHTNDNVEMHYEISGEGRPLLLLPGWTCTAKFWKKNIPELSKRCMVIAMDMRAHGQSAKVTHGHRIARYAMDLRSLLDHLNVDDTVALGWSMGASVL